jgi:hypothetical protein
MSEIELGYEIAQMEGNATFAFLTEDDREIARTLLEAAHADAQRTGQWGQEAKIIQARLSLTNALDDVYLPLCRRLLELYRRAGRTDDAVRRLELLLNG